MSARTMRDPLVVNTQDGSRWTRRTWSREGRGLYALAGSVVGCPDEVLATLAELAEHGLASMADVLPVPVGPEPQALSTERRAEIAARASIASEGPWRVVEGHEIHQGAEFGSFAIHVAQTDPACGCVQSAADAEFIAHAREDVPELLADNERLRARVAEAVATVARLEQKRVELERIANAERARVAELETERHSTNEALSDAAEALRANRDRIAELEAQLAVKDHTVDEDPIAFVLTDRADGFSRLNVPLQVLREDIAREPDTLPAWLRQRFTASGVSWETLDADERSYWEHQARAVRRAVARGGFKAQRPKDEDVTPQVEKLRALLGGQSADAEGEHYAVVHHDYRDGRDLPETGGAQ